MLRSRYRLHQPFDFGREPPSNSEAAWEATDPLTRLRVNRRGITFASLVIRTGSQPSTARVRKECP
jgi:hypothetical protein